MSFAATDTWDVIWLSVAALFAAFLVPLVPFVGAPLAAAAIATLAYRFHGATAWVVTAIAVVASGALLSWPQALVVVAPIVLAAGPIAAPALRKRPAASVAFFVGAVVLVVTVTALALDAASVGKSLGALVNSEMISTLRTFTNGSAAGGASARIDPVAYGRQLALLLPGWLVVTSALTGILVTAAISAVGARLGVEVSRLPRLTELRVSTYALVPIIVGLSALAGARFAPGVAGVAIGAIGGNLLVVAVPVLTAQGMGILLFWLRRIDVPRWGRALFAVVLLVLEPVLPLMTLAGLADTWLNLRRLPVDENGPGGTR